MPWPWAWNIFKASFDAILGTFSTFLIEDYWRQLKIIQDIEGNFSNLIFVVKRRSKLFFRPLEDTSQSKMKELWASYTAYYNYKFHFHNSHFETVFYITNYVPHYAERILDEIIANTFNHTVTELMSTH